MHNIKIQNYKFSMLWHSIAWLVGTEVSVRTFCFHLDGIWRQTQDAPPKHSYGYELYGVLTQTALWILITLSTSNPVPKIIKKKWSNDGNVMLGKLNNRWAVHFYTDTAVNITYFFHQLRTLFSYFASQINWGNEIWNISRLQTLPVQAHILGSGPHMMNFEVLLK
jgi:hypothetical protein